MPISIKVISVLLLGCLAVAVQPTAARRNTATDVDNARRAESLDASFGDRATFNSQSLNMDDGDEDDEQELMMQTIDLDASRFEQRGSEAAANVARFVLARWFRQG